MHHSFRQMVAVMHMGLALAVLALVVFWPAWRAELQAQSCYEFCDIEEASCLVGGDQPMNDCLDAAEETVQNRCADLSNEPILDWGSPFSEARFLPSEQQQCEDALLIGGSYTTANGVSISVSGSVSGSGPSIGGSVGTTLSTNTYGGLYNRCMDKYGTDLTREHDCTERRIQCYRTCSP